MKLHDLRTPALLLDRLRLESNAARMVERAKTSGVALRPHMKTAKSARVAEIATAGQTGAITVSTLAEADYFLRHGFSDITYAVCMTAEKLDEVAALQARGARMQLITDSLAAARLIAARARALGGTYPILVEIDSGEHRTGMASDDPNLVDLARLIHQAPGLQLAGVLTHGGHSYACASVEQVRQVAEEERRAVVTAAERLREAGLPCPTVSSGSTPTAVHAQSFAGVTEIRPGVYVFFDLAQYGRGSCRLADLALSVLATVIGQQPRHKRLLIDAGALALSKDTSANPFVRDAGYGWVTDLKGHRIGNLRVAALDQEHGYVEGTDMPFDRLPVGSKVRVLPNHACLTAAGYQRYAVIHGTEVEDTWDRAQGWYSQ